MATATESNVLEATARTPGTKNDARRVRVAGKVPAVVYGAGKDSLSVSLDPRQVTKILHSRTGHNTIFDLTLAGENTKAMIVDWQYEPIKGLVAAHRLEAHRHGQAAARRSSDCAQRRVCGG